MTDERADDGFRGLVTALPQLVFGCCGNGERTWPGPQWTVFTGLSAAGSLAFGWLDAVHPEDREVTMVAWSLAQLHGLLDVEFRVRRASDGMYLWHRTRSMPVRGGQGRVVEWLGTTTEVQDLKELQEQQRVGLPPGPAPVSERHHAPAGLAGRNSASLTFERIFISDDIVSTNTAAPISNRTIQFSPA